MKWILTFFLALALAFDTEAAKVNKVEAKTQRASDLLLSIHAFAFGGLRFAGIPSPGERAFQVLFSSPNALDHFKAIAKNGQPDAKLYALCAFHKLDPNLFEHESKALIAANPKVMLMQSCSFTEVQTATIVADISRGAYDQFLQEPSQPKR